MTFPKLESEAGARPGGPYLLALHLAGAVTRDAVSKEMEYRGGSSKEFSGVLYGASGM